MSQEGRPYSSAQGEQQASACKAIELSQELSHSAGVASQAPSQSSQGLIGVPYGALTLLRAGTLSSKLLLSGGLAGAFSRTVTAPIDRLKFLLQVQDGAAISIRQVDFLPSVFLLVQ